MRSIPAAPALIGIALLLGVTGCGGGSSPEESGSPSASSSPSTSTSPLSPPSPSTSPSTSASPSVSPSASASSPASSPPFPADLSPDDGGQGEGNGLGVTGVRVARNDGFDRVVFDLGGAGTPGWRVAYVARPVQEGSGDPVTIRGSAYLQVDLRGIGMPDDTGVPASGNSTTRIRGAGGGIAEVAPGGVFEGQQQAFIGLTGGRRPFRAFALTDPTRVVVDVRSD